MRAESPPIMFSTRILAGLVSAVLIASSATAARAAAKDMTSYLQLANITAIAGSASGQRGPVPVTVVLHVVSVDVSSELCRNIPAVRAAIMSSSSRSPIPFSNRKFDSDAVSNVIAREIEAAARVKGVIRVGFIYGTPKHAADTATDIIDPGDVTGQKQTMKSGSAGQNAPCRRIAGPPRDLDWTTAGNSQDTKEKDVNRPEPPLRDRNSQAQPKPAPAFQTHPQFSPKK